MNLRSLLSTALLALSGTVLYAAPVITMDVSIPSNIPETPHAVCATQDNGFMVAGTYSLYAGIYDVKYDMLMKVDSLGNRTGTLPFKYGSNFTGVVQAYDGSFVTCAYGWSGVANNIDWKIVKTDSTGTKIWKKTLGFEDIDEPGCIIQTSDSGFVVAGFVSKTAGDTTSALVKLDKNGAVVWTRVYPSAWSVVRSVKQTNDGGYILAGGVRGTTAWHGGMDVYLLKVDSRGVQQWCQVYGESGDEIGNSVDLTPDGGYVVAGSTTSFGSGQEDALVIKTDSLGIYKWHKTFGGSGADEALGIICSEDSTYILAANVRSFSNDSTAILYQLRNNGDSVWSARFNGYIENERMPLCKAGIASFAFCYSRTAAGDTGVGVVKFVDATIKLVNTYSCSSLILKTDGTLWACGNNRYGELGDGTGYGRETPVLIMTGVQSMASGINHSLILKTDGTLWACGNNRYGQLGDGTTNDRFSPVQIMTGVKSIAAGYWHSLFLKTDNTLWACGYNFDGELGDGTSIDRLTPIQVMTGVHGIAAGYWHSLILKTDTLWTCGYNSSGQLGAGSVSIRRNPLPIMSGVKSMSAGRSHSLILKADNTLWSCGNNEYGQLGDGTTNNQRYPIQIMIDVQSISAGENHSLILKSGNTLWACGLNLRGQLGDGTTTNRYTPIRVMNDVQSMSAGYAHSLILKTDSNLWACGWNLYGQLGDGTITDRLSPVQIQVGN